MKFATDNCCSHREQVFGALWRVQHTLAPVANMRAVVHGFRHSEQATEQARQHVIADAHCAYVEKFVAGWPCLQMLQVMSFPFAHVLQIMFPFPEHLVASSPSFKSLLHFVYRNCVSSANSAFKMHTRHSVFKPSKKLFVRLTPHVLQVRIVKLRLVCPKDNAAVHATQDLQ